MTRPLLDTRSPAQHHRLERFDAQESVDVHCHCLPGVDDGPATADDALELCRALVDDGVTTAIATPHQLGRFDGCLTADDIRQAVLDLNVALQARGIPLAVVAGADVRVDERIPALLDTDRVLTLADAGKYLLLELPHDTFINIQPLVAKLAARGVTPVLSHPERNVFLTRRPEAVLPWLESGALLQLTAASLVGHFGPGAEQAAWHWLATGAAPLVASDAHDTAARRPCMTQAIEAVALRLGDPEARRVCVLNPARLLAGDDVLAARHGLRPRNVR
jgi:protein-tyrosine phosphatase